MNKLHNKKHGIFFTKNEKILDILTSIIKINENIKIFEPACGDGNIILKILNICYNKNSEYEYIKKFVSKNLFFNDIDINMVNETKENINKFFMSKYGNEYNGIFNAYNFDFSQKISNDLFNKNDMLDKFDYIIMNPPYISLYGKWDKKLNEEQRIKYLNTFEQFPKNLKNGKLNTIMFFIENALNILNFGGRMGVIVDSSIFGDAYIHLRQYILQKSSIDEFYYNISGFENVRSGQVVMLITKTKKDNNKIKVIDYNNNITIKNQSEWNNDYKNRFLIGKNNSFIDKIDKSNCVNLIQFISKKNIRTCTMLLDREDEFTSFNSSNKNYSTFPYYKGSKSLKEKYGKFYFNKWLVWNTDLKKDINNKLKNELRLKGIKNKKIITFGDIRLYNNPKLYIRQSANDIICSYDENPSCANNSLYILSFPNYNEEKHKKILLYLCGVLNSNIISMYAKEKGIIKNFKGTYPQIRLCDLYDLKIPIENSIIEKVSKLVDGIYKYNKKDGIAKIEDILLNYFKIKEYI